MAILPELVLAIENDTRLSEEEKTEWKDRAGGMDEELQEILTQLLNAKNEEEFIMQRRKFERYKKKLEILLKDSAKKHMQNLYGEVEQAQKNMEMIRLTAIEAWSESTSDTI